MAAQWYAMDEKIMQNTYDIYAKYDSQDYDDYKMLDVVYDFDTQQSGNHIIGKGLAWEIMFNRVKDDNEKLDYLASFILDHSTPGGVYPETYQPNGNFSDVGNQEHASWQHYAMSCAYPELTKTYSLQILEELINEIQVLDAKLYTLDSYAKLSRALDAAISGYNVENITKEQCDALYEALLAAKNELTYLDADYQAVDAAIVAAEKLNKDDYKDFSKVEAAINAVVRGKNITQQAEVDAMAKAINDAIDTLEKKEGSVTPINSIKPVDKKPVVPNTGDENLMSLYISLIGIMAGLFVIIKKRKNIY